MAGAELIKVAHIIRTALADNLSALSSYPNAPNISTLGELNSAISDFEKHIDMPAIAEEKIKISNRKMRKLFSENGALMTYKFKKYIRLIQHSHPQVYFDFWLSSKIKKPMITPTALRGKVLEENGNPVFAAIVDIKSAGKSTKSTQLGNYKFFKLPKGDHEITIQHPDRTTMKSVISIRKGKATVQDFIFANNSEQKKQ